MPDGVKSVLWIKPPRAAIVAPGNKTPPTIICAVPRDAFDEMVSIDTLHQLDLRSLGIPFRLAVFGAETLEACKNKVPMALEELGLLPKGAVLAPVVMARLATKQ